MHVDTHGNRRELVDGFEDEKRLQIGRDGTVDWTRFEQQFDDWKGKKFRWQETLEDRLFAPDEVDFDHSFHSFYQKIQEVVWSQREEFKEPNKMLSDNTNYLDKWNIGKKSDFIDILIASFSISIIFTKLVFLFI